MVQLYLICLQIQGSGGTQLLLKAASAVKERRAPSVSRNSCGLSSITVEIEPSYIPPVGVVRSDAANVAASAASGTIDTAGEGEQKNEEMETEEDNLPDEIYFLL